MRHRNAAVSYSLPYTVRPDWPPFAIFTALGLLISFALLPIIQRSPSAVLPVVVIFCMVWGSIGILLLVIDSQKIVLLADRICYTVLFTRKEMPFSEITRIEVKLIRGRYVLQIYGAFSDKPLTIYLKPFSKRSISIVVDAIAIRAPSANIDATARQLREGTFRG